MKCAVKNCNSYNYKKASECSFFRFPSDIALQKQWISFCQRQEKFNPKTSYICMLHFKAEDFENTLQFDMGLATKRILKRGIVPTISCRSMENSQMQEERATRIQKRENKKIVNELLLNYNSSTVAVKDNDESSLDKENANPLNADGSVNREGNEMNSPHLLVEHFEFVQLLNCSNGEDLSLGNQFDSLPDATHTNDYISSLRSQIKTLQGQNRVLKKTLNKRVAEIRFKNEKIEKIKKKHEYGMDEIKKRLARAKFQLSNLEGKLQIIFTKGQIAKMKNNMKGRTWTEEDLTQSITLYGTSAKLYKLLYRKKFPLPAVSTLQNWAQKVDV